MVANWYRIKSSSAVAFLLITVLLQGFMLSSGYCSGSKKNKPKEQTKNEQEDKAKKNLSVCEKNILIIKNGLELFYSDHGIYPRSIDMLIPDYMSSIPKCPATGKDTYSSSYASFEDAKRFSLCCKSKAHAAAGIPEDYPRIDSKEGLMLKPGQVKKYPSYLDSSLSTTGPAEFKKGRESMEKKEYRAARFYFNNAIKLKVDQSTQNQILNYINEIDKALKSKK